MAPFKNISVSLLVGILSLCPASLSAGGRFDGTYAILQQSQVEGMRFRVRRNNIQNIYLTMITSCTSTETGEIQPGALAWGSGNSQNLLLSRSGRAVGSAATEDTGGRQALVNYDIRIRGNRATAVIAMVSHGVNDSCEGANTYRLRKAVRRPR